MKLTFKPNIHTAIWGHEEWLVSAHASSPSIIDGGEADGMALDEFWRRTHGSAFPLLVKIIEANDALSLQVHPNERTAPLTGGEPKTEMWHILDAKPGAVIYAGLKPGATPELLARKIADGTLADLLVEHKVAPGQTYFIPGGTVHAIGGGTRIFEVQQSSNTTYRLFDWNRKNPDGTSRELHIEKGARSVDYSLPPPVDSGDSLECEFFKFRKSPDGVITVKPGAASDWSISFSSQLSVCSLQL